jgi:hypothetical protein
LKIAESQAELAKITYDAYAAASTEVLEGIYKSVATEFAELYALINHDDEKGFAAKLTPSMGKLGFDVDFLWTGHFPPGAYHSEGHKDAMGLCESVPNREARGKRITKWIKVSKSSIGGPP